jgi:hypothetical protein
MNVPAGWGHLLGEEYGRREVVAKPENLGNGTIPVKVLGVHLEKIATGEWPSRRVEYVQGLMDELA